MYHNRIDTFSYADEFKKMQNILILKQLKIYKTNFV